MKLRFSFLAALAACAALAVETRTWTQSEASDFDKGTLKGLALSTEGRLSLAPVWKEIHDPSLAHLWSVARDSRGVIYAGGAEGRIVSLDAKSKPRLLATLEGGAVYALAVDAKDQLFAAVSPDAKIYRVDSNGKATLHAALKARYIWALVAAPAGALYAATGDPGQIQLIDAGGKATVLFDAGETHVRSLAAAPGGSLIAGTEPGGVVLRVSPKGEGFVLYQTARREVTALAVAPDGTVFAAASGNRTAAPAAPAMPPATPVQTVQVNAAGQGAAAQARPAAPPAALPPTFAASSAAAGSDVYSIAPDGEPRRVWTNPTTSVYSLALDKDGKLLLGTGNDGRIIRVDSPFASTRLIDAEPQQITALLSSPSGAVTAVSANPAKVFSLGPDLEKSGAIESDVLDAGGFTYWGRLRHEAELNGGDLKLEARSGNLENPNKNWSSWSAATGRIAAPPARYLAWRATFTASPSGLSPVLKLVEAAYQAKNAAPVVERIEITPANYKFGAGSSSLSASNSITLPGVGQARTASLPGASQATTTETGSASMNYEHGSLGARWRASDLNGDTLTSKVEIRGAGENEWKPLKDKLKESRFSFDSTSFADGLYRLRISVDDEVDNYPGQGLSALLISDEFTIDNTPPQIDSLSAAVEGADLVVSFKATDALSSLQSAEMSVNGGDWVAVEPSTRMTDSPSHDYVARIKKPIGTEYSVAVKILDDHDNVSVRKVIGH